MGDGAASYIRMVQHLIEKCLILHLSQEECVEALFKHANIKPVITSTVWRELEKENKEFFEAYSRDMERVLEDTASTVMETEDPDGVRGRRNQTGVI